MGPSLCESQRNWKKESAELTSAYAVAAFRPASAKAVTVDIIRLDIWITIVPSPLAAAPEVWKNVTAPNTRLFEATKAVGVPMNLSFLNATVYNVRFLVPA